MNKLEVAFTFGGMGYRLQTIDSVYAHLKDIISLYNPTQKSDHSVDVYVRILTSSLLTSEKKKDNLKIISSNPRTHYEIKDGFGYHINGIGDIFFRSSPEDKILRVDLVLESQIFRKNLLRKIIDREFNYPFQYLGQILHEHVLVPSVLLYSKNSIVVHGSSILNRKTGDVLVFSGTGGIGKTFLEMYFILNYGFSFFADDMTIISKEGFVYPNYAFPKIYKYNVKQLPILYDLVKMNHSGILNRLHWKFHSYLPSLGRYTRRKLNPRSLPNFTAVDKGKLSNLYILFRDFSVDAPQFDKIDPSSNRTYEYIFFNIIAAEYSLLFSHLRYHTFNRILLGLDPVFSIDTIKRKFQKVLSSYDIPVTLVKIPRDIDLKVLGDYLMSSWDEMLDMDL